MKIISIILTTAIMVSPISASAIFESGQILNDNSIEYEKSARGEHMFANSSDVNHFMGYVLGVTDTVTANNSVCLPKSVTQDQVASVISKFVNENPSLLKYSAYELVIEALKKNWSCKK